MMALGSLGTPFLSSEGLGVFQSKCKTLYAGFKAQVRPSVRVEREQLQDTPTQRGDRPSLHLLCRVLLKKEKQMPKVDSNDYCLLYWLALFRQLLLYI